MTMTPKTRLFLTIFLGVMSAMAPLSTDMYLPALPELTTDFGIPASVAQLTLTMTMIGMGAGQMIMGPVSDRYGRKGPLLAGMAVFALTAFGCAAVPDIRAFLVLRFLMGFAGASGIVIARAIARDVAEGVELTRFFAILMMVNGLAPILAPVIGGQVLLFSDWRGIFVLLIVVGLVQSGATMIYRETLPKEKRIENLGASFQKFPQLLHDKYFMGHCLTQCFVFGAFFSYIAGASFLFQNIYHVTPQAFSYIFGGIGVGLLVCGMVPARLAGRVPDVELLMGSLIVPALGSVALLAGFLCKAPIWYTIPVLFVTIVPLSIMGAASFSLALSRQGRNAGSASALIGFAQMILGGLMMPLVGIAGSDTAVPMGIIMLAGYTLGLLTFLVLVYPDHRRGGRIMGKIR